MIGKTPEEALQVLAERSRDNGRTPMQWSDQMNAGFSEGDLWIEQGDSYYIVNVSNEIEDPDSIFYYYVLGSAKLLKFGIHFPAPSGSSYWLGSDGTPCTDRERETWITARMGHVYSLASMLATLMLSLYWLHAAQNLQAFMELQS